MSYIYYLFTLMESGSYNKSDSGNVREAYYLMIIRGEGLIKTTLWKDMTGNYIFRALTLTWAGNDYFEGLKKAK